MSGNAEGVPSVFAREDVNDTEPTVVDPDAITDLSQVRWTTREAPRSDDPSDPSQGWHVIGEVGNDPDPYSREFFDLHLQKAEDGDGGDCSPWLADMVARKLSTGDEAGRAITRAITALDNALGLYPHDQQAIEEARALLAQHRR